MLGSGRHWRFWGAMSSWLSAPEPRLSWQWSELRAPLPWRPLSMCPVSDILHRPWLQGSLPASVWWDQHVLDPLQLQQHAPWLCGAASHAAGCQMLCSYCIVSLNGCFLVLPWWHIARNLMRRKSPELLSTWGGGDAWHVPEAPSPAEACFQCSQVWPGLS